MALYLAATPHSASAALVALRKEHLIKKPERDAPPTSKAQNPQGEASKVLAGAVVNISPEATIDPATVEAPEDRPHEAIRDFCPLEGRDSVDASPLVDHPVYFISTVLREARARYPMPQKLLLALLVASRKLRHYFQGHPIKVVQHTR